MDRLSLLSEVQNIMHNVFDEEDIVLKETTTDDDVECYG